MLSPRSWWDQRQESLGQRIVLGLGSCWPTSLSNEILQVPAPLSSSCHSPHRSSGINLTPFTLYIKFSRCWPHTLLYFQTECGLYEKTSILSLAKIEAEGRGQREGKCLWLSQVISTVPSSIF